MTATDKFLLTVSGVLLGSLTLVILGAFAAGLIADRVRSARREREYASAGSEEQEREHALMRAEQEADMPITIDSGLTPEERAKRTAWHTRIEQERLDIDAQFAALIESLAVDEPIVWKVDVSPEGIDRQLRESTRERMLRLGGPDAARVVRWAATDPGVPPLPSQRKRRSLTNYPSLARVLREVGPTGTPH